MKREIDLNRLEFGQPHWMQPSRAKLPSDTREAIRECYHRNYVELIRTGKNREGRAAPPSRSDRRFGHIPIDLRPIYRVAFHAAPVAVLNVPAVTAEDQGQFAAHRIDADGSVSIVATATIAVLVLVQHWFYP